MFWLIRKGCVPLLLLGLAVVLIGGGLIAVGRNSTPGPVTINGKPVTPLPAVDMSDRSTVLQNGEVVGQRLKPTQAVTGNIGGCLGNALGTDPYAFQYNSDGSFTETHSNETTQPYVRELTVPGCAGQRYAVFKVSYDGADAIVTKIDNPEAR